MSDDAQAGAGRYAPSPTGELHLGNLRTALVAWLHARARGGRFVLRLDDLDPDRVRADAVDGQLRDLAAIGVEWDSPVVLQSARFDRYEAALTQLAARDLVYPCFCSRAEIRAAASAPHGHSEDGAYPGTCARMSSAESAARIDAGDAACLRVRAASATLTYEDELLGAVTGTVDDFVVRRRDEVPAYNLATVVDDHDLSITHVVRGADLASTTPRQLWLARVLELDEPHHLHVPLVLGADGARLAKRHGSVTLEDLAALGMTPAQVRALLARSIGFTEPTASASPDQLVAAFLPQQVPTHDVQYALVDGAPRLEPMETGHAL